VYIPDQSQIFLWALGVIVALNLLLILLFVLFSKLSESRLKEIIRNIIFELDKITDDMENTEKHSKATQQISDLLGWQRIFIPMTLIGWVIDTEIATIRKIQQHMIAQNQIVMRQITLAQLNSLALQSKNALWSIAQDKERDVKLYLHWSAGHYGEFSSDHHLNIDQDGSIYITTNDLAIIKPHTCKRNAGAISISLACCYNATTDSLGDEPPTPCQIESMSQVVATLCNALDLTIDGYRVMTHAEAADNLDDLNPNYKDNGYPDGKYGPSASCNCWDLWFFPGATKGEGGNVLRGKAIWYQHHSLDV